MNNLVAVGLEKLEHKIPVHCAHLDDQPTRVELKCGIFIAFETDHRPGEHSPDEALGNAIRKVDQILTAF